MANKIRREEIGGEGIHVRDSYVWMEIFYLDSLSDYREHLPQDSHRKPDDSPLRSARDCFCSSMIGDALAGLAVAAIAILTVVFFYRLVDL